MGRDSFDDDDIDANYDIRFDLTESAPAWQASSDSIQINFADVNNDGKTDFILSRSADSPYVSISGSTFTVESSAVGTQRTNSGISYVLYQPASCPGGACWGAMPNLLKDYFDDYDFYDGTYGIKIVGAVVDDTIKVQGWADMNKDNKIDLILSSGVNPTGGYFMFGKTSWPASYDLNCTRDKASGAHCPVQILLK